VKITISAFANAPIDAVWKAWTTPEDIVQWNAASDDWHTPYATVDIREGGTFLSRMEAKDGSFGFDFGGTYTRVVPNREIAFVMGDGRTAETTFTAENGGVTITTTFDAEQSNPVEMQRDGWQAILDRFVRHVEQG
jgi:uncharacterized protein YndB with AHSA1/START domain